MMVWTLARFSHGLAYGWPNDDAGVIRYQAAGGSNERGYTNRHRPGKEHFPSGGHGRVRRGGVAQGPGAAQVAGVPGAAKGARGGDGGLGHGAVLGGGA